MYLSFLICVSVAEDGGVSLNQLANNVAMNGISPQTLKCESESKGVDWMFFKNKEQCLSSLV